MQSNETKQEREIDKSIADSKQDEQILRGIQPKRQFCFKVFKCCRLLGILSLILAVIMFVLTILPSFIPTFPPVITRFTSLPIYRIATLGVGGLGILFLIIMLLDRFLLLRKAPMDDWVFEIAEKRLGTSIIFYDAKYIYLNYDRGGKEVDKREFITEMSDKSEHFSYFYIKTDIDSGYIVVECKKRAPIPKKASFNKEDDPFWNIIPQGYTIIPDKQKIGVIGWYLNDQNVDDELYKSIPSTSYLICGGTGCMIDNTPIPMYNIIKEK